MPFTVAPPQVGERTGGAERGHVTAATTAPTVKTATAVNAITARRCFRRTT
jgi:hypothetical protein